MIGRTPPVASPPAGADARRVPPRCRARRRRARAGRRGALRAAEHRREDWPDGGRGRPRVLHTGRPCHRSVTPQVRAESEERERFGPFRLGQCASQDDPQLLGGICVAAGGQREQRITGPRILQHESQFRAFLGCQLVARGGLRDPGEHQFDATPVEADRIGSAPRHPVAARDPLTRSVDVVGDILLLAERVGDQNRLEFVPEARIARPPRTCATATLDAVGSGSPPRTLPVRFVHGRPPRSGRRDASRRSRFPARRAARRTHPRSARTARDRTIRAGPAIGRRP